jgi:hypothetical protein
MSRFERICHPLAAAAALSLLAGTALGSSHREAPLITEMPKVDATDFYMFRSYEPGREGYVTIVANYTPLQNPYGGPNYFSMDPDALYQICIDHNGDAREDITFEFDFNTTLKNIALNIGGVSVPIPLIQAGQIFKGNNSALNVHERFSAHVRRGDQYNGVQSPIFNAANGGTVFTKPTDYVGTKTFPDYEAYAGQYVYNITLPGTDTKGRMFVGQRKDPFVVNLGETFDLVNLNPLGAVNSEQDDLYDSNVTSIILEIPIAYLTAGNDPVIGGWTSANLRQTRTLKTNATFQAPTQETGPWIQVSRLANPLVNEVVIGLKDKNKFNASRPRNDAQFATYVTNPTLPALLNILFGVTAPCTPRNDLVAVFLTGVDGLNKPLNVQAAEMMRLNTAIPVTPAGMQSNLGVLGGDVAGYPNGRRPGDDVVDISLRAVMGVLYPDAGDPNGCAPQGNLPFTDGAFVDASYFDAAFPYLLTPLPGSPN